MEQFLLCAPLFLVQRTSACCYFFLQFPTMNLQTLLLNPNTLYQLLFFLILDFADALKECLKKRVISYPLPNHAALSQSYDIIACQVFYTSAFQSAKVLGRLLWDMANFKHRSCALETNVLFKWFKFIMHWSQDHQASVLRQWVLFLSECFLPGLVASKVVFAASVSHRKEQSMTWPSCRTGTDPGASNTILQPWYCAVAYVLSQPDSQVINKCIRWLSTFQYLDKSLLIFVHFCFLSFSFNIFILLPSTPMTWCVFISVVSAI